MISLEFSFSGKLWEYSGKGSWHFIILPQEIGADIKTFTRHTAYGFRTVRVSVKIGDSTWKTSLFPDTKSRSYLLPVKAAIRKAEGLSDQDIVAVEIEVLL